MSGEKKSVVETNSKTVSEFKVPPDPNSLLSRNTKRKRVKILEEEEYAEKVSSIIERDFFPELEKLKAQSQYIDATDNNDVPTMQRLQERFSSARVHARINTPSTFETPITDPSDGAAREDDEVASTSTATDASSVDPLLADSRPKESLDKFMAKHTSEDNESFHDLMEEQHKVFRHEKAWMFKAEEQLSIQQKAEQLALPSPEEQAKIACQTKMTKGTPEGWTYKNVNAIFYNPEGVELSKEEKIELAKKERAIVHENTRFNSNPWKSEVQSEDVLKTMVAKKEASLGKVGVDGKDVVERTGTPSINGYKLMKINDATPQIAPGESPMMTWGEVESTPYRLEGCETPLINNAAAKDGAPSFTMQAVPKRDRLALELAEKNSKFHRDKKGKAILKARANIRTPKTGSMTDKISAMSPAAQRLASSKLGIRLGTDKVLGAAYSPAPRTPSSSRRTPSSTPASRRAAIASSVKRAAGGSTPRTPSEGPKTPARVDDSLTDDLLNLPAPMSKGGGPKSGLQPDGSVLVDREKDYSFQFLKSLNWNRKLTRPTSSSNWMTMSDFESSMTYKQLIHQTNPRFRDLENPANFGVISSIRTKGRTLKSKKSAEVKEFSVINQHVEEAKNENKPKEPIDEYDDFLDEYGNLKDSDDELDLPSQPHQIPPTSAVAGVNNDSIDETESPSPATKVKKDKKEKMGLNHSKKHQDETNIRGNLRLAGFQLSEPRPSHLNAKEQKLYLDMLNCPDGMNHHNYQLFLSYQELVKEEQSEFQSFIKEVFDLTPELSLAPELRAFVNDSFKTKLDMVAKQNPQKFRPIGRLDTPDSMLRMVPLSHEQQERPQQFEMRLDRVLCEVGHLSKVLLPTPYAVGNTANPLNLTKDVSKLNETFKPEDAVGNNRVSEDPNVQLLIETYLPDVVISTSAAKVIFNNEGQLDKMWEIPFTVQIIKEKVVILVDKPFPPKHSLSLQKKRAWLMKKAAYCKLVGPFVKSKVGSYVTPIDLRELPVDGRASKLASGKQSGYSDDTFGDVVDISDLETFGLDAACKTTKADDPRPEEASGVRSCDTVDAIEGNKPMELSDTTGPKGHSQNGEPSKSDSAECETTTAGTIPQTDGAGDSSSDDGRMVIDDEPEAKRSTRLQAARTGSTCQKASLLSLLGQVEASTAGGSPQAGPSAPAATRVTRRSTAEASSDVIVSPKKKKLRVMDSSDEDDLEKEAERDSEDSEPFFRGFTLDEAKPSSNKHRLIPAYKVLSPRKNIEPLSDDDEIQENSEQPPEESDYPEKSQGQILDSNVTKSFDREGGRGRGFHRGGRGRLGQSRRSGEGVADPNILLPNTPREDSENSPVEGEPGSHHQQQQPEQSDYSEVNMASKEQKKQTGKNLAQVMRSFGRGRGSVRGGFRGGGVRDGGQARWPIGGGADPNLLSNIMSAQQTMYQHPRGGMSGGFPRQHNPLTTPFTENLHFSDPRELGPKIQLVSGQNRYKQNMTYNLWTLNPKTADSQGVRVTKNGSESEPLRIITRSSLHGVQRVGKKGAWCIRETISCKPENQPDFGCEVLTKSEIAGDWLGTLLRPKSKLIRIRANAHNHNIVHVEEKDLKALTKDGLDLDFRPGEMLGNLYTLFSGLKSKLPKLEGKYLLSHDARSGPFVRVLVADETMSSGGYDLHAAYSSVDPEADGNGTQAWLPIDPTIVTTRHAREARVPGLFAPRKQEQQQNHQQQGHNKKKKWFKQKREENE